MHQTHYSVLTKLATQHWRNNEIFRLPIFISMLRGKCKRKPSRIQGKLLAWKTRDLNSSLRLSESLQSSDWARGSSPGLHVKFRLPLFSGISMQCCPHPSAGLLRAAYTFEKIQTLSMNPFIAKHRPRQSPAQHSWTHIWQRPKSQLTFPMGQRCVHLLL